VELALVDHRSTLWQQEQRGDVPAFISPISGSIFGKMSGGGAPCVIYLNKQSYAPSIVFIRQIGCSRQVSWR